MTDETTKTKPEKKFKAGAITATLWKSRDETRKSLSVVFERTYKDATSGEWKSTNHFNAQDAATVALLAKRAFEYMVERE
jgi:hypothetical protein